MSVHGERPSDLVRERTLADREAERVLGYHERSGSVSRATPVRPPRTDLRGDGPVGGTASGASHFDGGHRGPDCPRGCESWEACDEPPECSAVNASDLTGERYGFGVCARGDCVEPCGDYGGCKR